MRENDVRPDAEPEDEIDRETATELPDREAMTIIAPPLISPFVKAVPADSGPIVQEPPGDKLDPPAQS